MQKENNYKTIFWIIPLALLVMVVLSQQSSSVEAEFSNLNGITNWGDEIHLSTTSVNGAFVPVIDYAPDGTIMVVYRHRTNGGFNIPYFTQSTSGGTTWSGPAPIRSSSVDIPQVSFAFDSNSLAHAVWRTDTNIFHSAENAWPGAGTAVAATVEAVLDPDIDVANDNTIHVVWAQGDTLSNIYHAYSQSGGAGWTVSPALATTTRKSIAPSISADNVGNVHVVWEERIFNVGQNGFVNEVRYKKGTWVGNNLVFDANPVTISDPDVNSNRPEIVAVTGNKIHVSYMEQTSDDEQYATYVYYNGTTWQTPVYINSNPVGVNQSDPFFLITTLDVCGVSAHVFFHGSLSPTSKEQIQGGNSADGWNFIEQVTEPASRSINPSFVCNGSQQLFLAYARIEESGPNAGTNQIYFVSQTGGGIYLPVILK